MFTKSKLLITSVIAAAMLCSCAGQGEGSSDSASSQDNGTATTRATVTLPAESTEAPDESSEAEQKTDKGDSCTPLMWKITNADGSEMILMGSMHALRPEIYPLPDRIMTAYENAEVLAVECDITSITGGFAAQLALLKNMTYENENETLETHLSKETYENISSFFEANGYSMDIVKHYKTWMASSLLEDIVTEKSDLHTESGIDVNLLQMAHDDGKEIYEVESYKFQMNMMMDFSDEVYDLVMNGYSADGEQELIEQSEQMYEVWKNGDLAEVEDFLLSEDEEAYAELTDEQIELLDEYNSTMLYDRNIGMADAAEKLLKEHKNSFFVVGLAHFIGDGGIIDLLTQRGYTVEQI